MAAVPVMVWLLWDPPGRGQAIAACAVFVIAMLTDVLDGYLARKWKLVSLAGAFLDPLADKLMVSTTMIMLTALGWLPAWLVAVIIARELTITGLRTVALSAGIAIPADALGKFKTAFQSTALGYVLWHYETTVWLWPETTVSVYSAGMVLMYIALGLTVLSGLNYLFSFFRQAKLKEQERLAQEAQPA